MLKISRFTSMLVLAFAVFFVAGVSAENEHIWLHVDGRYIKTSAYADPPEQVFMPVGAAWRYIESPPDITTGWLKSIGCNTMRLSFNALPNPVGEGIRTGIQYDNAHDYVQGYLAPIVESCKRSQIYVYIDHHEYMQQYGSSTWNSWAKEPWTKEQAQVWIDYWVEIADHFKDEPWVLGYELCNEPCYIDEGSCRENYLSCLRAIRQVDKRHIIILGSNEWSQARSAEPVWSALDFKPDQPYNQVVFSFHEYPRFFNIFKPSPENPDIEPVDSILTRVQNTYNVPMFCTEFGSDDPEGQKLEDEEKRQFQKDLIQSAYNHKIGWSLWALGGWNQPDKTVPVFTGDFYEDVWIPSAKEQGTPVPKPSVYELKAARVECTAYPYRLFADGVSTATVYASVCDAYGNTVKTAEGAVTFNIAGKSGVIEGAKEAAVENGRASVKVKSSDKKGRVTVTAGFSGLVPGTITLDVLKPEKKK